MVKLIQRVYSKRVRERLDPTRPKYSEAIKSIAAFAGGKDLVFEALVGHLDAACNEAEENA